MRLLGVAVGVWGAAGLLRGLCAPPAWRDCCWTAAFGEHVAHLLQLLTPVLTILRATQRLQTVPCAHATCLRTTGLQVTRSHLL